MSIPPALDYSLLTTWQTIDRETACQRICQNSNNTYHPGALNVAATIFNSLESKHRAQFFLKIEQIGLRGSKFFIIYKVDCDQDYGKFVQYIFDYKIEKNSSVHYNNYIQQDKAQNLI